jgi:GMP synthase (glutamine-hydrolysing)
MTMTAGSSRRMNDPMRVLIIMHTESEGPGTLGDFLLRAGATLQTASLHAGDRLPASPREFDALISMGGPMNVYEEARYPFLRDETEFLREAVAAGVPTLGICLGAQMIAKACGGSVRRSPVKELGWGTVSLTDAGASDRLFQDLPPTLPVFQWHEDTFDLPESASLLASGEECANQAFRCGRAYGLQFHVEVTRKMLAEWFADSPDRDAMLRRFDELQGALARHASQLYANFVSLACGWITGGST